MRLLIRYLVIFIFFVNVCSSQDRTHKIWNGAKNKFLFSQGQSTKCGYQSCAGRKEDKSVINVHIVNHSHDDVGWLKTVDQYFYGKNNSIQRAGVQYIITSVINELKKDPKRKFIWVETAFFKMWWNQQNEETKNLVKQLVNEGRFEFISGGWSMNDEAAAHYISIIDQMTLGHEWLLKTFGECAIPRIGWQIDPFGHSSEQASLFAQMGFDALFFGRLDHNDKNKRQTENTMEMIWRGSDDLGRASDLFTGVLPNCYMPPKGFCFDDTCDDEPIVEDKSSPEYNVERRVEDYVEAIRDQANNYKTNDIIHTMGSDFQYQNAFPWYSNLDRLMKYVNERYPKINVFYSTPSCYVKSKNDANIKWNTKNASDFFPYSSDPHAFWAGFYTSRPAFKRFERWASNHLQNTKHLQALADLVFPEHNRLRDVLREALGVSQHHDAITGTEKQHVYNDYVRTLSRGVESANQLIRMALNKIHNSTDYHPELIANDVEFCKKLNVSECASSEENSKFALHLYNPVAHKVNHLVRLPITKLRNDTQVLLLNSRGEEVPVEVVDISQRVQNLPERNSDAKKEIMFLAQLNATSLTTFTVDLNSVRKDAKSNALGKTFEKEKQSIFEGLGFKLHVDQKTGRTQKVVLDNGQEIKFEHNYKYYNAMKGDNSKFEFRASGAYIFRPDGSAREFVRSNEKPQITINDNFAQLHVNINDYVAETIRVHKNLPYIEFDFVVGPIPVDDSIGKEIITVFKTDLKTNSEIYTDSNGRQYLKRKRNSRPDYEYDESDEPIASNYYPMNSKTEIRDQSKKLRLAVLLDRSQGGTSMNDGEIEIMIHRRLLYDDAFGVDEALNEPGVNSKRENDGLIIRGTHRVLINSLEKSSENENTVNELATRNSLQPMIAFRKLDKSTDIREIYKKGTDESLLSAPLDKCVNLLTIESFGHFKLIRFEHLYGKMDRSDCSDKSIEIDVDKIFSEKYKAIIQAEVSLTATQSKDFSRLKWRSNFDDNENEKEISDRIFTYDSKQSDQNVIENQRFTIRPSEIKTFWISFRYINVNENK